jgi:N-methylhydantoinase A
MATRLGVDVGGTFTDLVFYDDETGAVTVAKGSTTPASPDQGVVTVVTEAIEANRLAAANLFLHGTTVGINALLERKGSVVGLLTTAGFRDVLETRRGEREAMYDMLWKPPPPLVPRRLRAPVTERILATGMIEVPLVEADVRAAAEIYAREGVVSVAIVFINAYANPAHELAAQEILRAAGFAGEISLSHEVSGEYREYERSSTTVVDAYVRPIVSGYLRRLESDLGSAGFEGDCLVTRSGGGSMLFSEAEARPFETVMSGPVAGAVGSAELCAALGITEAITADVGGTSFDTCLIVDGRPQVKYEGKVAGMPLQTPWVDVRSIGAGGGSIAYIDEGGLLVVGPRSAGAMPGPICYGRGGVEPTVTDAAAVLGMLAFGELAGGVRLDIGAARSALAKLGAEIGLDAEAAARGVLTIANAAMANAIRSVTIEQGQDPREATLIAFGGAGPLFGTLLADELNIGQVIVPSYAGNFSAWGLLGQDITRSAAVTSIHRLDDEHLAAANDALRGLFERLAARSTDTPLAVADEISEAALDLRYLGQEYTLTVRPPTAAGRIEATAEAVRAQFESDYERTFAHTLEEPVEIVSIRATVRRPLPRTSVRSAEQGTGGEERLIDAYSFNAGATVPFRVLQRSWLPVGSELQGPAIILEATTTTYVDADFRLRVDPSNVLFLTNTATTAGRLS